MSDQESKAAPNLLKMRPAKNCEYEEINGRIVLLVPRKQNIILKRLIPTRKRRSHLKLHLDEIGTYAWKHIDGQKCVLDIAHELKVKFGQAVEPVYPRLGMFINQMARQGVVLLRGEEENPKEVITEVKMCCGDDHDKI